MVVHPLALFTSSFHYIHAVAIEIKNRAREVHNVESISHALQEVRHLEEEPVAVASCVCINLHQQIVLVSLLIQIMDESRIQIAGFKVRVKHKNLSLVY